MLEYPCLTPDPDLVFAIFLPYYSYLDALPFLYSPDYFNFSAAHGSDLHHFLSSYSGGVWTRRHAHNHFLVMAGPAWDFSQDPSTDPRLFGTSFLKLPEFRNVTMLAVESRPLALAGARRPLPHLLPPGHAHQPRRLARTGTLLPPPQPHAHRLGDRGGGPNIRASIKAEYVNRTDVYEVVECSVGSCSHDPIRYMKHMLRSDFCLQPPGDNPTRRSTFDGILAGCISVFFEEVGARMQYGWHLSKGEYNQFSVYIPKEDVVFNGVRIQEVLESIPRDRVRRMRERVLELEPGVMYRRHGSSDGLWARKDAFDLAIEGVLCRIKRWLRSLSEPELLYDVDGDDL